MAKSVSRKKSLNKPLSLRIECTQRDVETWTSVSRTKKERTPYDHMSLVILSGKIVEPKRFKYKHGVVKILSSQHMTRSQTGALRIISKRAKIDQTLPFYGCHSSHCDWGPTVAAAECQEAPCAEIIAGPKDQNLMIDLPGFNGSCTTQKPKEAQN